METRCWYARLATTSSTRKVAIVAAMCVCAACAQAQSTQVGQLASSRQDSEAMRERIDKLEKEVSELKAVVRQLQSISSKPAPQSTSDGEAGNKSSTQQNIVQIEDRKTLDFLRDTTVNVGLDTYYGYNFNSSAGRVNLLRAYDVLSNEFSLNQASVVLERVPDVSAGRRLVPDPCGQPVGRQQYHGQEVEHATQSFGNTKD